MLSHLKIEPIRLSAIVTDEITAKTTTLSEHSVFGGSVNGTPCHFGRYNSDPTQNSSGVPGPKRFPHINKHCNLIFFNISKPRPFCFAFASFSLVLGTL